MSPQTEVTLPELIEAWPSMDPEERIQAFRALPRNQREDLFLDLRTEYQAELVLAMPGHERRTYMRVLEPDDAADVIQNASVEDRESLLGLIAEVPRREIKALMAYAEDDAGGLMNPRFARLRPDMTVAEAISYLRLQGRQVEIVYYAYVLDHVQRLLGVVSFRDLFGADSATRVSQIMQTGLVTVDEETDQEEVANLCSIHDLMAIPVLDGEGRMKGIVTVDDLVDVVQEEASEDIQKMAGIEALDAPYMDTSFWHLVRKRAGWLTVLFFGEMLTASAMERYEAQIASAVVLAVFIPLIISSGGNSGSQASTLVIRAIALGEIHIKDWWKVFRRELVSGVVLGSVLAVLGVARIALGGAVWGSFSEHYLLVGMAVGISLVGVVLFGCLVGSMLPFILHRLKIDPATASAPFVATLVDVTGLVIYFTVAGIILSGTLL